MDFTQIQNAIKEALDFAKAVNTAIAKITIKHSYIEIEFVNASCSKWTIPFQRGVK